MYKSKEAEKFVENLIINDISKDFIESLFDNSNNFLYSSISNIDIEADQGSYNTSNTNNYFSNYYEQKILQDFVDLNLQKNGAKIDFSNSIYCSTKYNNSLNNDYLIFPSKKIRYISGNFLNNFYKLITEIYEINYSDYIILSDKIIKDQNDLDIFAEYFLKNNIDIKKDKKGDIVDLNIHYYFKKLNKEKINDMIKYFIENFPHILYKYFEPKIDIKNLSNLNSSNYNDLYDITDSPTNVLLNGKFVYINYKIYQEEKFYIRLLLQNKKVHI